MSHVLECPFVVAEIHVLVRRRRFAAPIALDFGAQGEHVAKALHVEARVAREPEAGITHQLHRALGGLRLELETLGKHLRARAPVVGSDGPAYTLDVAGEVAFEGVAIAFRPIAHDEDTARPVRPDESHPLPER